MEELFFGQQYSEAVEMVDKVGRKKTFQKSFDKRGAHNGVDMGVKWILECSDKIA